MDDGVPEQRELASLEGVVMQDRARHARAPPDPGLPTPLEIESRVATGMSVSTDATRVPLRVVRSRRGTIVWVVAVNSAPRTTKNVTSTNSAVAWPNTYRCTAADAKTPTSRKDSDCSTALMKTTTARSIGAGDPRVESSYVGVPPPPTGRGRDRQRAGQAIR